jgi:hypothetical protein
LNCLSWLCGIRRKKRKEKSDGQQAFHAIDLAAASEFDT